MTTEVAVLSAGAAESLVRSLAERLRADLGVETSSTFGAVGAMKQRFLAGDACDVLITSAKVMSELVQAGHVRDRARDLGWVDTGVAVLDGVNVPDVSTSDAVGTVLRAASRIYFPDPDRATAGIHFASVLVKLGLDVHDVDVMKTFPNGRTAMRALAQEEALVAVGCTQVTEILQTDGVTYAGPLPEPYELATLYQCAVVDRATNPLKARDVVDLLTGVATVSRRESLGFRS